MIGKYKAAGQLILIAVQRHELELMCTEYWKIQHVAAKIERNNASYPLI